MSSVGPSQNAREGGSGAQLPVLPELEFDPALALLAMARVLDIPELLELILDFAVHDENQEARSRTLGAVRLVSKKWLTVVTNLMRKNKEPLYKLTLTEDNSLNEAQLVDAEGKLLDQFVTAVGNRIEEPLPTFSLDIEEEYFFLENYDSFLNALRQCGNGLVLLKLSLPVNAGSFPGLLHGVELPNLRKLQVCFTKIRLTRTFSGSDVPFGHPTNGLCLVQSLLSGAKSLKEFSLPFVRAHYVLPRGIEYVTLPESITDLKLNCQMRDSDLELLGRNKFPNIKFCTTTLDNVPTTEGVLSRAFERFSNTLQVLTIIRMDFYDGPPRHRHLVGFPVMKKLKELIICSNQFELESNLPRLRNCFPELKKLALWHHTPEMLRKWTRNACIDSVTTLHFFLIDESKPEKDPNYTLPLELETLQNIEAAFTNLTDLTIVIPASGASSLKHLFVTLRRLTYLRIMVQESELVVNSDLWDSVFTGAPVSLIQHLRGNPEHAECVELKNDLVSIRMLTELEELALTLKASSFLDWVPVILDFTFKFALLKMSNLWKLKLVGRFVASEAMTQEWKNMDGEITCSVQD